MSQSANGTTIQTRPTRDTQDVPSLVPGDSPLHHTSAPPPIAIANVSGGTLSHSRTPARKYVARLPNQAPFNSNGSSGQISQQQQNEAAAASFHGNLSSGRQSQPSVNSSAAGVGKAGDSQFNHAIRYLNKIKARYSDQETYKQFLDILQAYKKEAATAALQTQVYLQVQHLFKDAPDLLSELKVFLGEEVGPQNTLIDFPQSGNTSSSNEPGLDPDLLLERLSSLLKDRATREALRDVKKDQAQLLIDYLHSVLEGGTIAPANGLYKAILFFLYKICRTAQLYPHCYVLQGSSRGLHQAGGGFSDIYSGQFEKLQLCLKVMYAKEAIIWGSLSHPNVVPFYGVYYWNEECRQICLVSPWFSNGNLVEYLRQHPSTPRIPLIHDVSLGLEYLHNQGLVHGDIKGVNILVDGLGRACLADLGLSSIRTDQTLLHSIHATTISALSFRWAAPELTGESARFTVASDMWAFGCVCYEILKGELPFSSIQSDMQIIFKLISGSSPGSLDTIADADKNKVVREIMEGCWAREPAARLSSGEVVRKLGASLRSLEGEEEQSRERIRDFRNAMKTKAAPLDLAQIDQILNCVCVQQPTEEMSNG